MLDIIIMGEMIVEIMRKQDDMPLYEAHDFTGPYPSGAPAICIDAAARLGSKTAIVSGVGKDDFGECVLGRLKKDGVDTSFVLESGERSTGVAFVMYFSDGDRKFIYHMGNTPAVEAKCPDTTELESKYMHIMGCSLMANKDFAQEILKLMRAMSAKGTKISFDPNIRKELFTDDSIHAVIDEVMNNISIFLPGVQELLDTTGCDNIDDAVKKCFEYPKMELICLKNGSKGSNIYFKDGTVQSIGIYKVVQQDATGAGDCYDGAFLAGLAQGLEPIEAAKWGAAAGALNAAAFGPMEGKISPETVSEMIAKG